MERLKRIQEGVDEVISLINSRHGVGSFDGDIHRIADEAFKDCQFTDEECRHAAWLGFYENFRTLLNDRAQHRCINGCICVEREDFAE